MSASSPLLQRLICKAIKLKKLKANVRTGIVYSRRGPVLYVNNHGYIVTTINVMGLKKTVKAHQVVWLCADRDIPKGKVLDHKNRIKTDNRLCNLRLVSQQENLKNRRSFKGNMNPAAKINLRIAKEIRDEYKTGDWSYAYFSRKFKITKSTVSRIVTGKLWVHDVR